MSASPNTEAAPKLTILATSLIWRGGPPGRRTNRPTWQLPGSQVRPCTYRFVRVLHTGRDGQLSQQFNVGFSAEHVLPVVPFRWSPQLEPNWVGVWKVSLFATGHSFSHFGVGLDSQPVESRVARGPIFIDPTQPKLPGELMDPISNPTHAQLYPYTSKNSWPAIK